MPGNFKGESVGCEHVQGQTGSGEVGAEATFPGDLKTFQMDPQSFSLSPSVFTVLLAVLFHHLSLVLYKSHLIFPVRGRCPFISTSFHFPFRCAGLAHPDVHSALLSLRTPHLSADGDRNIPCSVWRITDRLLFFFFPFPSV